jgi:hypothetical protein
MREKNNLKVFLSLPLDEEIDVEYIVLPMSLSK